MAPGYSNTSKFQFLHGTIISNVTASQLKSEQRISIPSRYDYKLVVLCIAGNLSTISIPSRYDYKFLLLYSAFGL